MRGIATPVVTGLSSTFINEMTNRQFQALSTTALAAFVNSQFNGATPAEITDLNATQINSLERRRLRAIDRRRRFPA